MQRHDACAGDVVHAGGGCTAELQRSSSIDDGGQQLQPHLQLHAAKAACRIRRKQEQDESGCRVIKSKVIELHLHQHIPPPHQPSGVVDDLMGDAHAAARQEAAFRSSQPD
eukprot:1158757-Pelagomonas_calceolata.AAC.13